MENLINKLSEQFPLSSFEEKNKYLAFVNIDKKHAVAFINHLRDFEDFTHLVLLTAVDWIEEDKFQLTYLLNNASRKIDLGIRVFIERENAEMYSIHHLWKQAATYQRELKEMFGIHFPGSPRIDKNFILEGWEEIPPYRRDFDTKKYSEETYFPRPGRSTNDPSEYMKQKLYPND